MTMLTPSRFRVLGHAIAAPSVTHATTVRAMTTSRPLAATALLTLALALGACSDNAGTPAETGDTETSAAETTEPATATVDQWASVIAEQQAQVEEVQAEWEDATCSSIAVGEGASDCLAYLTAMTFTANAAAVTLSGAADPSSPTYVGEPPSEVAELVTDTVDAAEAVSSAGDAVECPGDNCTGTAFTFTRAWGDFRDQLAAWGPYL